MVGAHNGNVVNNVELRQQFMAEGMTVRSQNDGESCVHAVERYINRGYDFIDAIRRAYGDLQGDYAFVIGRINDDKLYAIKKGSGLVVGIGEGFTCVSSDLPSILPLTRKIMRLQDGEIITLWADRVELHSVKDGSADRARAGNRHRDDGSGAKGRLSPISCSRKSTSSRRWRAKCCTCWTASPDVAAVLDKMKAARHLYFIGCGTSYHACLAGAVYFAQLAGQGRHPGAGAAVHPAVLPRRSTREDVGLFVSQSGETKDVLNALEAAEAQRHDLLRSGQRDRLHADQGHRLLAAAVLRLRDQRAGHQDLHQPGGHLPVPGLPPGRARHQRTGRASPT